MGKKFFPGISGSVTHNVTWDSSTMPNFRKKTNDTVPRKHLDRSTDGRTEGQKDGQTLFYRTFPAIAVGPKIHTHIKKCKNFRKLLRFSELC